MISENLYDVKSRKEKMARQLGERERYLNREERLHVEHTGEKSTRQMLALLGIGDLVTSVNIPNYGQISNLIMVAIVDTNVTFRYGSITPILAGEIPMDQAREMYKEMLENTKEYLTMYDLSQIK